ncbi:hypothetical protein FLBR109950_05620 [Flavobacterium branchiophilum]
MNHVLHTVLGIKGRVHFLLMECYGHYCEQSYREEFNFFEFNKSLFAMINTFICKFGINPIKPINKIIIQKLLNFGNIVA